MSVYERLEALNIALPKLTPPVAAFVPFLCSGNLIFLAGHIRTCGNNPDVPEWLKEDYFKAIRELAEIGAVQVLQAKSPEESLSMLSILAIAVGARTHARFLLDYSDEEMLEMDFK